VSGIKNPESFILREVGTLARSINSISDINFKELHLQKGQFIFLTRVCENPGINQIDLSNLLKVDKTTTTKVMQKLIQAGYISKRRDDTDKRMWRLYPEKKGFEIYNLVIQEENRNVEMCFNNFSEKEKESAYYLVKKMRENIENEWKEIKKI
jgi:DNA-binding MarR family transcriptional regulator